MLRANKHNLNIMI